MVRFLFSIVVTAALPVMAVAAPPATVDLFPANTLAYAEVVDTKATMAAVESWLKGTNLGGGVAKIHTRRDAIQDVNHVHGHGKIAQLLLYTSKVFLNDCAKTKGAACALLSVQGTPRWVFAVHLGDSTALAMVCQQTVTTDTNIRRVATLEGIPICQIRPYGTPSTSPDGIHQPINKLEPTPGQGEWTAAYTPGLFVVGSDALAVQDVLLRWLGKGTTPSLGAEIPFQETRKLIKDEQIFLYIKPEAILASHNLAKLKVENVVDPDWLAAMTLGINPKAIKTLSGGIRLTHAGWTAHVHGEVDANTIGPMVKLIKKALSQDEPVIIGKDLAVLKWQLPQKGSRTAPVLATADAIAKAKGLLGPLPSDRLVGQPDVKQLMESVVTVACHSNKNQHFVILECETTAAATAIADALPALVAKACRLEKTAKPAMEVFAGVQVFVLPIDNNPSLAYALEGTRIIIGTSPAELPNRLRNKNEGYGLAVSWPELAALFETPLKPTHDAAAIAIGSALLYANRPTPPVTLTQSLQGLPPIVFGFSHEKGIQLSATHKVTPEQRVATLDKLLDWYEQTLNQQPRPVPIPTMPGGIRGLIDR